MRSGGGKGRHDQQERATRQECRGEGHENVRNGQQVSRGAMWTALYKQAHNGLCSRKSGPSGTRCYLLNQVLSSLRQDAIQPSLLRAGKQTRLRQCMGAQRIWAGWSHLAVA